MALYELFEQMFREPFIAQKYLPEVKAGDKRTHKAAPIAHKAADHNLDVILLDAILLGVPVAPEQSLIRQRLLYPTDQRNNVLKMSPFSTLF